MIGGDPVHPRGKGAVPSEPTNVCYDLDQDFLCGVLGIFRMPQHPQGKLVDFSLHGPDQFFQGASAALPGFFHQVFHVFNIPHKLSCRVSFLNKLKNGSRAKPPRRQEIQNLIFGFPICPNPEIQMNLFASRRVVLPLSLTLPLNRFLLKSVQTLLPLRLGVFAREWVICFLHSRLFAPSSPLVFVNHLDTEKGKL